MVGLNNLSLSHAAWLLALRRRPNHEVNFRALLKAQGRYFNTAFPLHSFYSNLCIVKHKSRSARCSSNRVSDGLKRSLGARDPETNAALQSLPNSAITSLTAS